MVMTRKDYKLIADSLNKEAEAIESNKLNDNMTKYLYALQLYGVRNRLAFDLMETNPNYDRSKFYEATSKVDEIERKLFNEEE